MAADPVLDFPQDMQCYFRDNAAFSRLAPPAPGEWRAVHPEDSGQSFIEFSGYWVNRRTDSRRTLYLLPLSYRATHSNGYPPLGAFRQFLQAYFGVQVEALPPARLTTIHARKTTDGNRRQLDADDILTHLDRTKPDDAYAIIAVTSLDLHRDARDRFVFGVGSPTKAVATISLARLTPQFYGLKLPRIHAGRLIAQRVAKVIAHELGHALGMQHCTEHRCVMNGVNSLRELDSLPLHICPRDLLKLHYATGVSPSLRYTRLLSFYYEHPEFDLEAKWLQGRIDALNATLIETVEEDQTPTSRPGSTPSM